MLFKYEYGLKTFICIITSIKIEYARLGHILSDTNPNPSNIGTNVLSQRGIGKCFITTGALLWVMIALLLLLLFKEEKKKGFKVKSGNKLGPVTLGFSLY